MSLSLFLSSLAITAAAHGSTVLVTPTHGNVRLSPKVAEQLAALNAAQAAAAKPVMVASTTTVGASVAADDSKRELQAQLQTAAQQAGEDNDSQVQTLPSGVTVEHLTKGQGAKPGPNDRVTVHYRGTLLNGTEFDSSYKRGQPITFGLNQVIPCWTQALQTMGVGGKAELTCPSETAYGSRAVGPIPPSSTLKFEVELLGVQP